MQQTPLERAEFLWDRWMRDHDDVSAIELAGALAALVSRCKANDNGALQARVNVALSHLSHRERVALRAVLETLGQPSGITIIGTIGRRVGVSRDTVLLALRILSMADLLRTSSMGMKGTRLDFLPPEAYHLLVQALER